MSTNANPFAMPIPRRNIISITGRRIIASPWRQGNELRWANAMKNKSASAMIQLTTETVREHAQVYDGDENPVQIPNYNGDVLMQEEFDLLFMIRFVSYGQDFPFSFTCPHCKDIQDGLVINTTQCRRYMMECGDAACECHEVNDIAREVPDDKWHFMDFMDAHWTTVPEDHLKQSPPELIYRPENDTTLSAISRAAYKGCEFHYAFPTIKQKSRLSQHSDSSDPKAVSIWLEECIAKVVWEQHNINTFTEGRERDSKRAVKKILAKIEEPGLRMSLRSYLENKTGGLDSRIRIDCVNPVCGTANRVRIPVNQDFFLPHRLEVK